MAEPLVRSGKTAFTHATGARPLYGRPGVLNHYIRRVLPAIKDLLCFWEERAGLIADQELRRQALASLQLKAFHCQGGAVLVIGCPEWEAVLMWVVVAYQTLCDYLDNLCDRAGETDGQAFLQLHQCLLAALDAGRPQVDYYQLYPYRDDRGYIAALVEECRRGLAQLPSYHLVREDVLQLAGWYIDLQVNKHLSWELREKRLQEWVNGSLATGPCLLWNEWAAASGSTLALFALFNLAAQQDLQSGPVGEMMEAYFPWICALHILLDYLIDQEEDRQGGDLNFINYYRNGAQMEQRIKIIIRQARKRAAGLPGNDLHLTVVEGLLAMYLSDAKVWQQGLRREARGFIRECGGAAYPVYLLCRLVRNFL